MARNIMDDLKKCCDIWIKEDISIFIPQCPDPIMLMARTEIISFDLIGIFVDYESNMLFIPWTSIAYLQPIVEEGTTDVKK